MYTNDEMVFISILCIFLGIFFLYLNKKLARVRVAGSKKSLEVLTNKKLSQDAKQLYNLSGSFYRVMLIGTSIILILGGIYFLLVSFGIFSE